ncbi:MAG: SDR family NAD(P)-dependent oxidoreductase [Candidatus Sumerlaeia bacterium]|nr:SDR family NAD(P)-dependent oxidoreductase [Candidatus Sumerlaeia bacterium]
MSSLQGRRVLVTGAGGFIGSHLVEHLVEEGAMVRAFVHYRSRQPRGWLHGASLPVEFVAGDIRDSLSVREAMRDCEVVFHLAALIGIPYSYVAPDSYVGTNITGTLNVLQGARELGTPRVIVTSTSEVYGTALQVPIPESHPLQAQSPYSATKIAADHLAESYYRSFNLPVVIARPFNTFGPRQSARAVIPTVLAQLLSGARQIKVGALSPTRDMNYVRNTTSGFLACALANSQCHGRTYNFGSGRDESIGELIGRMMRITGTQAEIVCEEKRLRPEKSEVERLVADARRARNELGWAASISLDQGLEQTAQWIAEHLDEYTVNEYTV